MGSTLPSGQSITSVLGSAPGAQSPCEIPGREMLLRLQVVIWFPSGLTPGMVGAACPCPISWDSPVPSQTASPPSPKLSPQARLFPPSFLSQQQRERGKTRAEIHYGKQKKKKAKPCQRRENPSGFTPSSTVHSGAGAACGSEHFWGTQRDDSPRSVPAPGWMLGKQPQPLNNSPGSQPPESLIFGKL